MSNSSGGKKNRDKEIGKWAIGSSFKGLIYSKLKKRWYCYDILYMALFYPVNTFLIYIDFSCWVVLLLILRHWHRHSVMHNWICISSCCGFHRAFIQRVVVVEYIFISFLEFGWLVKLLCKQLRLKKDHCKLFYSLRKHTLFYIGLKLISFWIVAFHHQRCILSIQDQFKN